MSNRSTRRQALAAIVLANELPAPDEITFRGASVSIHLDSVADLLAWLPFFRIDKECVSTQQYTRIAGTDNAGQTSTLATAHAERNWRGWRVHLAALDPVSAADRPLDAATRAALAEVAAGGEKITLTTRCPVCELLDIPHDGVALASHRTLLGHDCAGSGWPISGETA